MTESDRVTLPASWGSALLNGDYSGLDDQDLAEAQRCRAVERAYAADGWQFGACDDAAYFTWHYRLYDTGADCHGGHVLDYTIIKR